MRDQLHKKIVDIEHPYLGLDSFREEHERFFFGRHQEIQELFVRVKDNILTVLFSRSGNGKTSLLRAGLLPELRRAGYQPIEIRLLFNKDALPLAQQVRQAFLEQYNKDSGSRSVVYHRESPSLWEMLHHIEKRPEELAVKTPVFIFDQFEEVFTLGEQPSSKTQIQELFSEIAGLVENRVPEYLVGQLRRNPSQARTFDFNQVPLRVIVAIRDDFLSQLELWQDVVPSFMRNRMPLHLLNGLQALKAVVEPARLGDREIVSEELGRQIVRLVAEAGPETPVEEIEAVPPILSLVCEELNDQRLKAGGQTIASVSREDVEHILNRFYENRYRGLAGEEAIRRIVEEKLVTETGYRLPVPMADLLREFAASQVPDAHTALEELIHRRLLNREERHGIQWIEIIHDRLIEHVKKARADRRREELKAEEERRRTRTVCTEQLITFLLDSLAAEIPDSSRADLIDKIKIYYSGLAVQELAAPEAKRNQARLAHMRGQLFLIGGGYKNGATKP